MLLLAIPQNILISTITNGYVSMPCLHVRLLNLIPLAPASILTSALKGTTAAAHSAFATLAAATQVAPGSAVPDVDVKINAPDQKLNFSKLQGKNVIVLVPAAFSPVCSETVSSGMLWLYATLYIEKELRLMIWLLPRHSKFPGTLSDMINSPPRVSRIFTFFPSTTSSVSRKPSSRCVRLAEFFPDRHERLG